MVISIVTICFNDLAGLRKTVASVLQQDYPHLEYMVIDGQSTDGTIEFLQEVPNRVSWQSEGDSGIAEAFNKGLRRAGGDLLLFLNAGDTLSDATTLSGVVASIPHHVSPRASIIYGDFCCITGLETERLTADHRLLMKSNTINHQSTLVGREVYQRFSYDPRLFLGMDYDYWLRCLSAGITFVKVDIVIAKFLSGGRSSNLKFRLHNELFRFFLRALNGNKVLRGPELLQLMKIGISTWWAATWRQQLPQSWRRKLRSLLERCRPLALLLG